MPRLTQSTIATLTGKQLDPFSPRPDQIDARDIAAGLSFTVRYAGQLSYVYTVAEHSVLVARLVAGGDPARRGAFQTAGGWSTDTRRLARLALLHDAEEAYLGDLVRPVKHHPSMTAYRELATRLQGVIVEALVGAAPTVAERDAVHGADQLACDMEHERSFRSACAGWVEARVAWLDAWTAVST